MNFHCRELSCHPQVVRVQKSNDDWRLCGDQYPVPNLGDISEKRHAMSVILNFVLVRDDYLISSTQHQPRSPLLDYMRFGLSTGAPHSIQRFIDQVFLCKTFGFEYIGDVPLASKTANEHTAIFFINGLKEHRMFINAIKMLEKVRSRFGDTKYPHVVL